MSCGKEKEDNSFPTTESLRACGITESFTLQLTGNYYSTIKNYSLPNLEISFLDFNSNNIEQIEPAAFDSITGLKVLDLSNNYLRGAIKFGDYEKEVELRCV
jgi:Leucine-rich repeat (LRR) protein